MRKDDGDRLGYPLRSQGRHRRDRDDHVYLEPDKLGCQNRNPIEFPVRRPVVDDEVPALDPAELMQPLPKRFDPKCFR